MVLIMYIQNRNKSQYLQFVQIKIRDTNIKTFIFVLKCRMQTLI